MSDSVPVRLFVAIDPPTAIGKVLGALATPMRDVVWTPPPQYHLTLRFIGEVDLAMRESIATALAAIEVESFVLPLVGLGSFPSTRCPRVLWAGVGTAHPRLFQLRQRVDDALLSTGLDLDVRKFHPHLTLARCGRASLSSEVAQWLRRHAEFAGPSFRIDAFTLFASELKRFGPVHTPLLRVELGRGKTAS